MKKIIVSLLVLAAPIVSYATLTQTGVTTTISGNNSITTFQVSVSESASYYLKFWLMGVKHTDNSYSSYNIRIDNNVVTDYVETDRGDWYLYKPKNNPSVYLTAGNHVISLEGSVSDVPNAERISGSIYNNPFQVNDVMQNYQKRKNHQALGPVMAGFNYSQIEYNYSLTSTSSPQFRYTGELNKEVYYTFCRLEYYTSGQTVSFTTDVLDDVDHVLNVFSLSDPDTYSWAAVSTSSGHATMSLTIPQTGFYYVMVRSSDPDEWGLCNMTINNDRVFESVPVNCSYTEINENELNNLNWNPDYACFAKRALDGDPVIMLMDEDGIVIKYNDNYPYNSSVSSYNWGVNARIDGKLSAGQWILTTSKSYPLTQYFDIYTGCELGSYMDDDFPNYKQNDVIYSGGSASNYNCISWSLGEWLVGYWLDNSFISPDETITYYNALDSLYAVYGYTSNGATEANAIIDLWEKNDICTHASIRAKENQYAAGYDWESKLGGYVRVFHPRYALDSPNTYGQVFTHYIEAPNSPGPGGGVILNIPLSQDEYKIIEKAVSTIPDREKSRFANFYDQCLTNGTIKVSICIDTYEEIEPYNELLSLCKNDSKLHYLLYQKICNREILAIKLLKDLTLDSRHSNLWSETKWELMERCKSDGQQKQIFTVQAQALLLVKALLADEQTRGALSEIVRKEATCSSDPMVETSILGNQLTIKFNVSTDATVSLLVGTVDGSRIMTIMSSQKINKGQQEVCMSLPSPGVYTVGLIVNGCVYKKKVYVK